MGTVPVKLQSYVDVHYLWIDSPLFYHSSYYWLVDTRSSFSLLKQK